MTKGTVAEAVGTFTFFTILNFFYGASLLFVGYQQYQEKIFFSSLLWFGALIVGIYMSARHLQWLWNLAQLEIIRGWVLAVFVILSFGFMFYFLMLASMTGILLHKTGSVIPYVFGFQLVQSVLGFVLLMFYMVRQILSKIFP